jgi:hypothetical protein
MTSRKVNNESSILRTGNSPATSTIKRGGFNASPNIVISNERVHEEVDSPGTKILKTFRKVDYGSARVVALNDSKDYLPFKKDNELLHQMSIRDSGSFVPKGNPYRVSKISEVILVKDRREIEKMKLNSQLSRKSSISNQSRNKKVPKSQQYSQDLSNTMTKRDSAARK